MPSIELVRYFNRDETVYARSEPPLSPRTCSRDERNVDSGGFSMHRGEPIGWNGT